MVKEKIMEILQEQLSLSSERERALLEQIRRQSIQIEQLSEQLQHQTIQIQQQSLQITELTATIQSLEASIRSKDNNLQSLKAQNRGLGKLIGNKSEKIAVVAQTADEAQSAAVHVTVPPPQEKPAYNPKDRGNNNARRKEFFDIETVIEDVYPDDPAFDIQKAKIISHTDSVLYKFVPGKFIKHISRQWNCLQDEKIFSGKTMQKAPLLNSNYDSSFIAGMLQLRYVYSMPVERIIKYFNENGFEVSKSAAHSLIAKSAGMMERLDDVLKKTILQDSYICMDETYYTILTGEKNEHDKGVRKGYIWAALANKSKLIRFFYENGSRSKEVFTDYVHTEYQGAIQSDRLSNYKVIESDAYPDAFRLGCFQHCKRKFLDIEADDDAAQIVAIINCLYLNEHLIKDDWTPDEIHKHRQKYAPPILKKLKKRLIEIQSNPQTLPKSPLSKAVNYMLGEFDALSNYILRHDYALDNNAVERCMRYISLSRKNSLFCGSHDGAKRMALIYSLACSCRLNNINTFHYFTDILSRLIHISPVAPDEVFVNLLPHRWTKKLLNAEK
jgi:hypothetical protein